MRDLLIVSCWDRIYVGFDDMDFDNLQGGGTRFQEPHNFLEILVFRAHACKASRRALDVLPTTQQTLIVPSLSPTGHKKFTIPMTPLSLAAYSGFDAAVKTILQKMQHYQRSASDAYNCEPILLNALLCAMRPAAPTWSKSIFSALVEVVDINSRADGLGGWTALHIAVWLGDETIVELLLKDKMVDPNIEDHNGLTALSIALTLQRETILHMLLAHEKQKKRTKEILLAILMAEQSFWNLLIAYHQDDLLRRNRDGHTLLDDILWSALKNSPELFSRTKDIFILRSQHEERNPEVFGLIASIIHNRPPKDQPYPGNSGIETLILAIATHSRLIFDAVLQLYPQALLISDERGRTPLMAAAWFQNDEVIEHILNTASKLEPSTFVNAIDRSGSTAFSYALFEEDSDIGIMSTQVHIADMLYNSLGFDHRQILSPPEVGRSGISPLMQMVNAMSIFSSSRDSVYTASVPGLSSTLLNMLRSAGSSMTENELSESVRSQKDETGRNLLGYLCQMKEPACLKALLSFCPALQVELQRIDSAGLSMLTYAIRGSSVFSPTLRYLLDESKIPVDLQDAAGQTALTTAIIEGSKNSFGGLEGTVADMLMDEYGADPLLADHQGHCPIWQMLVSYEGYDELPSRIMTILEVEDDFSPLFRVDIHGDTILVPAILNGRLKVSKLLLKRQAGVIGLNSLDNSGQSLLTRCILYARQWRAAALLLDHEGIQPDIPDHRGNTPLHYLLFHMRDCLRQGDLDSSSAWDVAEKIMGRDDVNLLQESEEGTYLDLALLVVEEVITRGLDKYRGKVLEAESRELWVLIQAHRNEQLETKDKIRQFLMDVGEAWEWEIYEYLKARY